MLLPFRQVDLGRMFRLLLHVFLLTAAGCQPSEDGPKSWQQKLAEAPYRSPESVAADVDAWRAPLETEPLERTTGGSGSSAVVLQPEHRWGNMLHRLCAGDTLYKVARSYYGDGKYWRFIFAENRNVIKTPGSVRVGQLVHLPTDPLRNADGSPARRPDRRPDHYVVGAGDSLSGIARWLLGDEQLWRSIMRLNRDVVADPNKLLSGTVLRIPQDR